MSQWIQPLPSREQLEAAKHFQSRDKAKICALSIALQNYQRIESGFGHIGQHKNCADCERYNIGKQALEL